MRPVGAAELCLERDVLLRPGPASSALACVLVGAPLHPHPPCAHTSRWESGRDGLLPLRRGSYVTVVLPGPRWDQPSLLRTTRQAVTFERPNQVHKPHNYGDRRDLKQCLRISRCVPERACCLGGPDGACLWHGILHVFIRCLMSMGFVSVQC